MVFIKGGSLQGVVAVALVDGVRRLLHALDWLEKGCPDFILDWWVTFVMGMLQTWLLWDAAVIPVRNNLQQANTQEDRHGQVRGTSFSLETPA